MYEYKGFINLDSSIIASFTYREVVSILNVSSRVHKVNTILFRQYWLRACAGVQVATFSLPATGLLLNSDSIDRCYIHLLVGILAHVFLLVTLAVRTSYDWQLITVAPLASRVHHSTAPILILITLRLGAIITLNIKLSGFFWCVIPLDWDNDYNGRNIFLSFSHFDCISINKSSKCGAFPSTVILWNDTLQHFSSSVIRHI